MSGFPDRRSIIPILKSHPLVLSTGVAIIFLTLATTAAIPMPLAGALFIAIVPVIGPSAGIGGAAGVFIHDIARGVIGYWTFGLAVWLFGYAWLVRRFVPQASEGYLPRESVPSLPTLISTLCAFGVAGIISSAAAAWVTTVFQGQPFHLAATAYLWVLPAAMGGGVLVILFQGQLGLAGAAPTAAKTVEPTTRFRSDGGGGHAGNPGRPPTRAAVGLLAAGLVWFVGMIVLDLLAHDLALFATEQELRYYVEQVVGSGSMVAGVVMPVMVAILRYGEPVVLLSVPLVAGIVMWVYQSEVVTAQDVA